MLLLILSSLPSALLASDSWRHDPIWDDGKAEFAHYAVEWPRYGESRSGSAVLVVVKEPWAPDLAVKADSPRDDGYEVLKLNHIRDVQTGIYAYHQMASSFVRRDDGRLVKLATSSAEACGISSAEMSDGILSTSSYFDGQGRRAIPWDPEVVPQDALAMMLRDYVLAETLPGHLQVFPSLLAGKLPELEPLHMTLARGERASVDVPAGRFDVVALELTAAGFSLAFDFETALPHRLIRLRGSDGTSYHLTKVERLAYWELNRPGDEAWLPGSTVATD